MNDTVAGSPVLDAIMARRSVGALGEPAPSAAALETILAAATTVPDHGGLRPYRFVVVDAGAHARFGDALAHDTDLARGGISEEVKGKFRKKAGTAPIQVLIVFSPVESTKAPEWEQLVAASCTGYPMLLAAQALGLGAAWRSAAVLDGPAMVALCGLQAGERVLGWLNIGTPVVEAPRGREPVSLEGLVMRAQ
jgi:nitroreductase